MIVHFCFKILERLYRNQDSKSMKIKRKKDSEAKARIIHKI